MLNTDTHLTTHKTRVVVELTFSSINLEIFTKKKKTTIFRLYQTRRSSVDQWQRQRQSTFTIWKWQSYRPWKTLYFCGQTEPCRKNPCKSHPTRSCSENAYSQRRAQGNPLWIVRTVRFPSELRGNRLARLFGRRSFFVQHSFTQLDGIPSSPVLPKNNRRFRCRTR